MADEAAPQREQEPLRCSDPNPIAGRCGVGSPFCPPEWRWRTGNRVQDMYFTAPSGERFRSKNELKAYLDKASNPPKMSEFLWRVPPDLLKDGQLPGENVQTPLRGPPSNKGSGHGGSRKRSHKRKAAEVRERNGKAAEDTDKANLSKLKDVARKTLMVQPSSLPISAKKPSPCALDLDEKPVQVTSNFSSEPKIEPQAFTSLPFLSPEHEAPEVVPVKRKRGRPPKNKSASQQVAAVDNKASGPPAVKRKRGRPPASVDDHNFMAVLSTVTSYKWLLDTSEDLRRFMEEAGRLDQKPEQEMTEYRRVLLARSHDVVSMKRYSKPVLHVFVRILRNEEAPEILDRTMLADLCCSWRCKHKRHSCLLEEGRVQALRTSITDKETSSSGKGESEAGQGLLPESEAPVSQLQNGASMPLPGHTGNGSNVLRGLDVKLEPIDNMPIANTTISDQTANGNARRQKGATAPPLAVCFCKACSKEADFCRGCMCSLCCDIASPVEAWRVMKCISCQHLFHLECAVSNNYAGVVKELGLDVEFLCPLCSCKMDLFPFWRERLDGAIASEDVTTLENHVGAAVLVLKGTQRRQYAPLNDQMVQAYNILLGRSNYPEVYRLLQQIEQQLETLGVNQLSTGDSNASVSDLQDRERELLDMEVRVFQMQRLVDAHHKEWSEADRVVETQRAVFEEAKKNLDLAKEAAKVKCDQASTSRLLIQKEKHTLTLLREKAEPVVFSGVELEAKHAVMEAETAKLQVLENKLRSLDAVHDETEIATLKEKVAIQGIRTRVARSIYDKLLVLR